MFVGTGNTTRNLCGESNTTGARTFLQKIVKGAACFPFWRKNWCFVQGRCLDLSALTGEM